MADIEISNARGNRNDPARVRINEGDDLVLDTTTRLTVTALPIDNRGVVYPPAYIDETPPFRCYLYDWLQWINFSLQRFEYNVITGKELQRELEDFVAFDVYPRRQATFVQVTAATYEPVYSDLPPQTEELYELLDRLINRDPVPLDPQAPAAVARITADGSPRITSDGGARLVVLDAGAFA